jgi:UDP-N-acetylmuramoyl-tripeptide--D-alanyl-D-alanine ligase
MNSVADVAAEHAALVRALPGGGTGIFNADDVFVDCWRAAAREQHGVAVIEFALDHPAAVRGNSRPAPHGSTLEIATPSGDVTVALAAPGRHNAANALAASAAALALGVPLAAVAHGLAAFRPVTGRLATVRAASGAVVIDDTYNANPDSVRAAIDVLAAAPGSRWLVLGDMGEVGAHGPAFHREIGEYACAAGVERLLTTGTLAAEAAAAFGAGAEHFASVEALAAHLAESVGPGTTLLVKGSRFMRMERVVAAVGGVTRAEGAH